MSTEIHVAAAVIKGGDGRILIAKRPSSKHQGGLWEFPGGKVEAGESLESALHRELMEELGIETLLGDPANFPLIQIHHDYGDKRVFLDVWSVSAFQGEAHGCEGQPLAWVEPHRLPEFTFPAANQPIVSAARLPSRYLITGDSRTTAEFAASLELALQQGIRLVQFRAKKLPEALYRERLSLAVALCTQYDADMLLNANPEFGLSESVAGLHLDAQRLMSLDRRPLPKNCWVAASCHNEAELRQAETLGLDFVVLSPVMPTASHPDAIPLGWQAFAQWTKGCKLPVFALGGMTEADMDQARQCGAQGIAAISAWWQSAG